MKRNSCFSFHGGLLSLWHQTLFTETAVVLGSHCRLGPQDHVVYDLDPYDLAGLHHLLGLRYVRGARGGITAGVIVHQHHAAAIRQNRIPEQFPGVHVRPVQ